MKIEKLKSLLFINDNLEQEMFNIYCDEFLFQERVDEIHNEDNYYQWIQRHYIDDVCDKTLRKCFIIFNDDKIIFNNKKENYYSHNRIKQVIKEFLKIFDEDYYNELYVLEEL
jgi:hypothetical protein